MDDSQKDLTKAAWSVGFHHESRAEPSRSYCLSSTRPPEPSAAPTGARDRARSRRPARALRTRAVFLVALACLFAFPTLAEAQAPNIITLSRGSEPGTYYLGETISVNVVFSAAVTVTGTPQLALVIGTDTTPRADRAVGEQDSGPQPCQRADTADLPVPATGEGSQGRAAEQTRS